MAICSPRHHPPRIARRLRRAVRLAVPAQARAARKGATARCLVIVLRGGLDGLSAVAPVGDPDWVRLRGDKALALDGKPPALPLDAFFALNPAMPHLHRLYQAGQATIVHAAATPYRERSHFDGQDVLESGLPRPGPRRLRLAQPRARRRSSRPGAPIRATPRLRGRPGDAAGGARAGAGALVDAAAHPARERRHHDAPRRSLPPHRPGACARDRGAHGAREHGARRRHERDGSDRGQPDAGRLRRAGARLFRRGRRHRGEIPGARRTARASARSPSTAGTPTSTRAPPAAGSRRCSARSTARSRRSRPRWARPGARPWSRSSPSSAAPRASTAPTAPTTAPRRWRCSPAARSRAAA